jgi:hypothetical protein
MFRDDGPAARRQANPAKRHARRLRATAHTRRAAVIAPIVVLGMALGAPALAADPHPAAQPPRSACLAAVRRAELAHGIPAGLLVAIALSESGLHAHALNIGGRAHFPDQVATARLLLAQAPAHASVMAGCLQVNARVHARGSDWPLDPRRAADWSAQHLRRFEAGSADWTSALIRWHGGSPASSRRVVCRVRAKLEAVSPGADILRDVGCGSGPTVARVRRDGAKLLEVAEAGDR